MSFLENSLSDHDHERKLKTVTEYLFLLTLVDILKQAKPGYYDNFIAAQLITSTGLFKIEDSTFPLVEQYCDNNKEEMVGFVTAKYAELIEEALVYIKNNLLNPEKYVLVPLTPAVRRSVLTTLESRGNDIFMDMHRVGYVGISSTFREVETMAAMLEGHFGMCRSLANDMTKNWNADSASMTYTDRNMVINPQVFHTYLKQLSKSVYIFGSSRDLKHIEYQFKYIANILSIFLHLVVPIEIMKKGIGTTDDMYHEFIRERSDCKKVINYLRSHKHFSSTNINNVVCSECEIFYDLHKDMSAGYEIDTEVERYLILSNLLKM